MGKNTAGYFSIIQYMPCRSRMEGTNIGIFLYCENPFFFGVAGKNLEDKRIAFDLEATSNRLHSIATGGIGKIKEFIRTRANEIFITDMRFVKIKTDPNVTLHDLFGELVL